MHVFDVGVSGMGKSSLLKLAAYDALQAGTRVAVVDPDDTWWPEGCMMCEDAYHLLEVTRRNLSGLAFIDEAGEAVGESGTKQARDLKKLGTNIRKYGWRAWFATPNATDVSNKIRNQCSSLYAFLQDEDSIKVLEKRFMVNLSAISDLEPYEYIYTRVRGPIVKRRLPPLESLPEELRRCLR